MNQFITRRRIHFALLTLGVLAGMIVCAICTTPSQPKTQRAAPARVQGWEKINPRLQQAEKDGAQAGERHLQRITEFFAEKEQHRTDFAEEALGWGSKWAFVKGTLCGDNGKAHQDYLRGAFERHVFTASDLQELLQAVVTAYLSELEGQENALLVAIRADLSEQDLPALRALAALRSDDAFQIEYQKMLVQVVPTISRDLKITVGREAVVWVGGEIAAVVTARIASAVAVRLGVSGGILGSGAFSGLATLGLGVIVSFIVDAAVDWIMRWAGYDPAAKIAGAVSVSLRRIQDLLLDGDAEAQANYVKLRHLQEHDRYQFVRAECRKAADRVETGGSLGLRHEFNRIRQLRGRLREAALKKLLVKGRAS